jgi:Protein of unknown function (DUF2380)
MRGSRRRTLGALAATILLPLAHPVRGQQPLKKLLMLDFELIDEQAPDVPFPEGPARLAMISRRLREAFVRERFYEVIDPAPVAALIEATRKTQNVLDCTGCDVEIARAAGVDRMLLGWVQKVSNLILNINIEVREATGGKPVLVKSVDLRGNTDQSWQRGIDYLVRDMVEKRQGNR